MYPGQYAKYPKIMRNPYNYLLFLIHTSVFNRRMGTVSIIYECIALVPRPKFKNLYSLNHEFIIRLKPDSWHFKTFR
jgi:hypothetical protein